jgi:hypothetical protein
MAYCMVIDMSQHGPRGVIGPSTEFADVFALINGAFALVAVFVKLIVAR